MELCPHIHSLPIELIVQIFLPFLFAQHIHFFHPTRFTKSLKLSQPPQAWLGSVCKRWHNIISSTSIFWTSIIILSTTSHSQIEFWLERSSNRPLDICCFAQSFTDAQESSVIPLIDHAKLIDLFSLLIPQSHRWRELAVIGGDTSMALTIWTRLISTHDLTQLKTLRFDSQRGIPAVPDLLTDQESCMLVAMVPSLTTLSLSKLSILYAFTVASQLTHLELGRSDPDTPWMSMASTLQQCQALKRLRLHGGFSDSWNGEQQMIVSLPKLHAFHLAEMSPYRARQCLARFYTPAIAELSLSFPFPECPRTYTELVTALTEASFTPTLQRLAICGMECDEKEMRRFLETLQALTCLEFDLNGPSAHYLGPLFRTPPVLPNLREIIASGGALLDVQHLVLARKEMHQPVSRIVVYKDPLEPHATWSRWLVDNVNDVQFVSGEARAYL